MGKWWLLVLGIAATCLGCTSSALEQQTLTQIHSGAGFRTTAVLDCLAVVAAKYLLQLIR